MYGQMSGYNPYLTNYTNQLQNAQIGGATQSQGIIRVNGIDGAKTFSMQANSTVALFDENNDYFFLKTTDGAGFPTIRTFAFKEVKQENTPSNEYVTKKEFDELKEAIENGKFNIPKQQNEYKFSNNKSGKNVNE